jgi:hypothetical protein
MRNEAIRLLQAVVDHVLDRNGAFGIFQLDENLKEPSPELIRQRAQQVLDSGRYMHSGATDELVRLLIHLANILHA